MSADRYDSSVDHDDYTQVGMLWKIFPEDEKQRTIAAIAGALGECDGEIKQRQLCHFFRAAEDFGRRVAAMMSPEIPTF